jgi:hypothetical protein
MEIRDLAFSNASCRMRGSALISAGPVSSELSAGESRRVARLVGLSTCRLTRRCRPTVRAGVVWRPQKIGPRGQRKIASCETDLSHPRLCCLISDACCFVAFSTITHSDLSYYATALRGAPIKAPSPHYSLALLLQSRLRMPVSQRGCAILQ